MIMAMNPTNSRGAGSGDRFLTLNELNIGEKACIVSIKGDKFLKKRLRDLGFVRGTPIVLEKVALFGDPMDFLLRGYHVLLRRSEASTVFIEKHEHEQAG